MKAKELLKKLNACTEAIEWVEDRTVEQAWQDCERGDWMLWFYAKQYPEKIIELTLAKGHCANTVRHLMKDQRSIKAVDAAIAYGYGLISDTDLKIASYVANAAYIDSSVADNSASYAAYSAYSATTYADDNAKDAASYAAFAVFADDNDYDARKENQKLTADICRKYLTLGEK